MCRKINLTIPKIWTVFLLLNTLIALWFVCTLLYSNEDAIIIVVTILAIFPLGIFPFSNEKKKEIKQHGRLVSDHIQLAESPKWEALKFCWFIENSQLGMIHSLLWFARKLMSITNMLFKVFHNLPLCFQSTLFILCESGIWTSMHSALLLYSGHWKTKIFLSLL